jgi:hypothetical protein
MINGLKCKALLRDIPKFWVALIPRFPDRKGGFFRCGTVQPLQASNGSFVRRSDQVRLPIRAGFT